MMKAHREHDLTKEESIGYVIAMMAAANVTTTVGEINYVIQEMAIAWSPITEHVETQWRNRRRMAFTHEC